MSTSVSVDRRVRSFKVRRGRMSARKLDALNRVGPRWRLDLPADHGSSLDLRTTFGRSAPRLLDVGFGTGETTVAWAVDHPDQDVLAVDVHTAGVARLLHAIDEQGLTNVRLAEVDVWDVLDRLPAGGLAHVRVLFPDPWPKRRHHQRRLVQRPFVERVAEILETGGVLHVATDWDDYASEVRDLLARTKGLVFDRSGPDGFSPPRPRPVTPYEQRGVAAGRPIRDLVATRR